MNKVSSGFPKVGAVVLLICIMAMGIGLRFVNLGKLNFWIDEPYHAYVAESLNETGKAVLPSGMIYYHGYFYNDLVAYSIRIFGSNEFGVRFPSALFGVLSILIVYWIGKRILGERVGLLASFFMSVSYLNLAWARVARFYTLYQCIFLIGVLLFYLGLERGVRIRGEGTKRSYVQNLGVGFLSMGLGVVFLLLAYRIHMSTVLFLPAAICYFLLLGIWILLKGSVVDALRSKYSLALGLIGVGMIVGFIFFDFGGTLKWAFTYRPDWANTSRFQDRYFYYNFFTSHMIFPLGAFFLMGVITTFTWLKRGAIFFLLQFVVAVGIASLVFSYKLTNYVYHVFPFYLIIGSYGFFHLYDLGVESLGNRLKTTFPTRCWSSGKIVRSIVFLMMLGWIPVTLWFKMGIRFPNLNYGQYNLVHTFQAWRWAAETVNSQKTDGDVILSTIPLTLMYYGLESHYNLNNGNNNLSISRNVRDEEGRLLDPYSGVLTLLDLEAVEAVVEVHPSGWLVTNEYTMNLESCVAPEVKAFVTEHFTLYDTNEGVQIFRWGNGEGGPVRGVF